MPPDLASPRSADRLLSLDVLRGLTVAGMVLVTDPGTYSFVFPQLRHAEWNGPTLADLIFPCFLVTVGVSLTLSFAARLARGADARGLAAHVLRRSVLLVVLGVAVNWTYDLSWQHLRMPGILPRIGVCYLVVGLLYLWLQRVFVSRRNRTAALGLAAVALLAGYWFLLRFYPTPGFGAGRLDSLGSLPAVVDRAVFTVPHLFRYGLLTPGVGVAYDPEGLLSTLGALVAVLVGCAAGETLRSAMPLRRRAGALAALGTVLWLLGLGMQPLMPLNKAIYTPTFALWSSGLCVLALALFVAVVDVARVVRGWTLLLVFGTNAIFAFVLSQVVTRVLSAVRMPAAHGGSEGLYSWLCDRLFLPWLPPRMASLAYAMLIVLLIAALVNPLYRRRIFLRI